MRLKDSEDRRGHPATDLRQRVQTVYSQIAADPSAKHPFRIGRRLAQRAGYPDNWLDQIPAESVDSFAGVSCLPCFAQVTKAGRVLDLGCGAGLDSLLIAPSAQSVLGLDFSPNMLARARTSAAALQIGNLEFREGEAEQIPVETAAIDVVVVNGIFNLNPGRKTIFHELARVLRQGGVVFAAEIILKGPLPSAVVPSETDWFS